MIAAAQIGYLHATPTGSEAARIDEHGGAWGVPELGRVRYLFDALFEVGPVQPTGMGISPVQWSEIVAYSQGTGAIAEPWEIRAIRDMSESYLAALRQGENPLCIAPAERAARKEQAK